jgi:hypothetical protein
MDAILSSGMQGAVPLSLAATTADAVVVYGLMAVLIGLIVWSKVRDPESADSIRGTLSAPAATPLAAAPASPPPVVAADEPQAGSAASP